MKYSIAAIALAVAAAHAAGISDIPECSQECFIEKLSSDGCSSLTDFACHCEKPELISEITPCVKEACASSPDDITAAGKAVVGICAGAGVPISLPESGGSESSGATSESSVVASASSTGYFAVSYPSSYPSSTATTSGYLPYASGYAYNTSIPFEGASNKVTGSFFGVIAAAAVAAFAL
ncbi:MAG: hypothetical protein M1825_003182 [Sarcosagium campestre]|nr:MAG: hypothetical protein M1825_003182 [Sarcosagium campestre]